MSGARALWMVCVALAVGASLWRRGKLRRAVRGLPTRARRALGPAPDYPLPDGGVPDGLAPFAALQRRTRWIMFLCWGLAGGFAIFILALTAGEAP